MVKPWIDEMTIELSGRIGSSHRTAIEATVTELLEQRQVKELDDLLLEANELRRRLSQGIRTPRETDLQASRREAMASAMRLIS